jgi:signal transduction histidine kinase
MKNENCKNAEILVVDDTPAAVSLVRTALEEAGYHISVATTGEKAIKRAELTKPDLILLDVLMPGIDGYETCKRLKNRETTKDIPIIFMTVLSETFEKVKGFDLGAVDYVNKPIETEELLARVQTHVTIHRLQQELQAEISERRQAEIALQQANDALRQRTAELELANKELKDFAYIVSHDLKSPLRGISRLTSWLVQDYPDTFDEEGKEMAELLIGRVKRMDSLIDGILDYSRVGRIIGNNEQIDLNALVSDVIEMIAPPESIRIVVEQTLPVIVGDRIRIVQVFQNLLSNAVEFMDKPDGKIRIGCVDEGTYWRFQITDNGPGIDPKYHEKIFRIFQTLTPRDVRESTGVGLAIVKKIVEFYGGRIWIESEAGQGSLFSFTLPKQSG